MVWQFVPLEALACLRHAPVFGLVMGFLSRMMHRADERRRKRQRAEEIASWIILPIILLFGYLIYAQVWPMIRKPVGQFIQEMNARQR